MIEKLKTIDTRLETLYKILESCELCPRKCKVNRTIGMKGVCDAGMEMVVSSYGQHLGEEPELVGTYGSGTIFFTGCNLLCIYCQNYDISHRKTGQTTSCEELARIVLYLQKVGCHNINFVTPTHFTPQIVQSLKEALSKGLKIPIVWNCGGYESVEVIRLLEGIVDIYMPDIKYSCSKVAETYSSTPDYFERCKEAVTEMHKQVGDLKVDSDGIAKKGLLVRHLVLPNNLAGSEEVFKFVASLSKNSYINIMAQYRPCGESYKYPAINRRITSEEFQKVLDIAWNVGLRRGF
ncbi:radical SAM protein [bacterium]|nr:radical SAM protein [bacterium]